MPDATASALLGSVPPGTSAWILAWPVKEAAYWPQNELLLEKTGGSAMAYFGRSAARNTGEEFILLLVLADPVVNARFRALRKAPYNSMPELPHGVLILDRLA